MIPRDAEGRFQQRTEMPSRVRPRRVKECPLCHRSYRNDIFARHFRTCKLVGSTCFESSQLVTSEPSTDGTVESDAVANHETNTLTESAMERNFEESCLSNLIDQYKTKTSSPTYVFSETPNELTCSVKLSGFKQVQKLFGISKISQLCDFDFITNIPHDERLLKSIRDSKDDHVSQSTVSNRLVSLADFLLFCTSQVKVFSASQIETLKQIEIDIRAASREALICKAKASTRSMHRPISDDIDIDQAKKFFKYLFEQKFLMFTTTSKATLTQRRNILISVIAIYCNCFNVCRPSSIARITKTEFEQRLKSQQYKTIVVDKQKNSTTNFPYISLNKDITKCVIDPIDPIDILADRLLGTSGNSTLIKRCLAKQLHCYIGMCFCNGVQLWVITRLNVNG